MRTANCDLCHVQSDTFRWPTSTGGHVFVCRPCLDRRPRDPKPRDTLPLIAAKILIAPFVIVATPVLLGLAVAYFIGDFVMDGIRNFR